MEVTLRHLKKIWGKKSRISAAFHAENESGEPKIVYMAKSGRLELPIAKQKHAGSCDLEERPIDSGIILQDPFDVATPEIKTGYRLAPIYNKTPERYFVS